MEAADPTIELTGEDLRTVARYAAACAAPALTIFEDARPADPRPRQAVESAQRFADGGPRTKAIRDAAWAAMRAGQEARDAGELAASEAARAALLAASAPYLHPLAKASQVEHILGPAAHAARAFELRAGDDHAVGAAHLQRARALAGDDLVDVLTRFPAAPDGRGRAGRLLRDLDAALRG